MMSRGKPLWFFQLAQISSCVALRVASDPDIVDKSHSQQAVLMSLLISTKNSKRLNCFEFFLHII